MFRFFCKKLSQNLHRTKDLTTNHARFLQTHTLKSNSNSSNQQSLTVSYLVNSCGLSLDSALSASKKVTIETTEKPDSVLQLFKTHGFTDTQIANIITKYPPFVLSDPDKTLKPKIEFFESLGFSRPDLTKLITSAGRTLLLRSLSNQIIPALNFLKSFLHTNENIITALKQCIHIVERNVQIYLEPNIETLRAHGVPDSIIAKLLLMQPKPLLLKNDMFKEVVKVVEKMGFDPKSRSFVLAIRAITAMSKSMWERKVEVLKSFGLSEEDTLLAFKLQPMCMISSEMKIRKLSEFYVNELGLKPCDIAKHPNLLLVSFEKRLIPRCSVLQFLLSKGLLDGKELKISRALVSGRKNFEKKFVTKYQEINPEVVKAYRGEMGYPTLDTLRSLSRI